MLREDETGTRQVFFSGCNHSSHFVSPARGQVSDEIKLKRTSSLPGVNVEEVQDIEVWGSG